MKKMLFFASVFIHTLGFCSLEDHIIPIETQEQYQTVVNQVDHIYMINLDQRPMKFQRSLAALLPYDIVPQRFSAIYGWDLDRDILDDLGITFEKGMEYGQWVLCAHKYKNGVLDYDFLTEDSIGKNVYSRFMSVGGIGCALSHLSIIKDALDKGHEMIWVLEDEIQVWQDPKVLETLIDKLDNLVGRKGWDILYTDTDCADTYLYTEFNDFFSDLNGLPEIFWRPNLNISGIEKYKKREILGDDFIKIGSRMRTHSMLINRQGMEKIWNFFKEHGLYLPYDHELATIPGIQLYNLQYDVVSRHTEEISDIRADHFSAHRKWSHFQRVLLEEYAQRYGKNTLGHASCIMDFVRHIKPDTIVEIGPFAGASTYPMVKTLEFLEKGKIFCIDPWSTEEAIEGVVNQTHRKYYEEVNFIQIQEHFIRNCFTPTEMKFLNILNQKSCETVNEFDDNSIDLLFVDGNTSEEGSLQDIKLYFPKVKTGGFILINNGNFLEKNSSIQYLMQSCEWLKDESYGMNCVIFKKN